MRLNLQNHKHIGASVRKTIYLQKTCSSITICYRMDVGSCVEQVRGLLIKFIKVEKNCVSITVISLFQVNKRLFYLKSNRKLYLWLLLLIQSLSLLFLALVRFQVFNCYKRRLIGYKPKIFSPEYVTSQSTFSKGHKGENIPQYTPNP